MAGGAGEERPRWTLIDKNHSDAHRSSVTHGGGRKFEARRAEYRHYTTPQRAGGHGGGYCRERVVHCTTSLYMTGGLVRVLCLAGASCRPISDCTTTTTKVQVRKEKIFRHAAAKWDFEGEQHSEMRKLEAKHFSKIFLKRGASCKAVLKNTRGVC